jgi:excisionase family DNA binding protein
MHEKAPDATATFSSVDELASYIGLGRTNTYAALRNGKIPSIRIGKKFVIPRSAIKKWLEGAGTAQSMAGKV